MNQLFKRQNYDENNQGDFAKLVWYLANKQKMANENKEITKEIVKQTADMSIKEVLDQQFKISKKANNEWKYEFRRQ